jgi:hypothetical protein
MKQKFLEAIYKKLDDSVDIFTQEELITFYKTIYLPNYGLINKINVIIPTSHQYTLTGLKIEALFDVAKQMVQEGMVSCKTVKDLMHVVDLLLIKLRKYV